MWHNLKTKTIEHMCILRYLNISEIENCDDREMLRKWKERTRKQVVEELEKIDLFLPKEMEAVEPKDMPKFLNELAITINDEEVRWKLIQCSLFINIVNGSSKGKC